MLYVIGWRAVDLHETCIFVMWVYFSSKRFSSAENKRKIRDNQKSQKCPSPGVCWHGRWYHVVMIVLLQTVLSSIVTGTRVKVSLKGYTGKIEKVQHLVTVTTLSYTTMTIGNFSTLSYKKCDLPNDCEHTTSEASLRIFYVESPTATHYCPQN